MLIDINPYLGAVMRAVRSDRPILPADQPFFNRVEKVPAGNYVEVWFRTGGCTWDNAGGCTMCNYGHGSPVTAAAAVASVQAALDELPEHPDELMISPSGGMWDPGEVPPDALEPIYALAAKAGPRRFFVETRAETIDPQRIDQLRAALPGTELAVEVGLESAFDAVLVYCVNKGSTSETFRRSAETLRSHGIFSYANVSLGTAFLDRASAVRDAIATVRWALANGADTTVLFPLHIKPYTLLELLQRHDRYQPVSLWDLVDSLYALGPAFAPRVEIAWYKSYYDTAKKITTSPSGCGSCHSELVEELDRYRASLDFAVIDTLQRRRCQCAAAPAPDIEPQTDTAIAEGVLEHYGFLASVLGLDDMWTRWQPRLEPAVYRAFADYGARVRSSHVA